MKIKDFKFQIGRLLTSAPTGIALAAIGLLTTMNCRGANPSFSDFDPIWFATDGLKVTMKNTPSFGSFDVNQFTTANGAVALTGLLPASAFPLGTWGGPSASLDLTVPEQVYEASANCTVTGFQNLLHDRCLISRLLINNSSDSSITVSWPAAVVSADGNASASCASGRTLVVTFTTHGWFVMVETQPLWSQNPPATVATATALTPSLSPTVSGQSVCFVAGITNGPVLTPFPPDLTGTVTFQDGGTSMGTRSAGSDGTARFCTASLGVGTHSITGTYNGGYDDNGNPYYDASTSLALNFTVNKADTSIVIYSSCNSCGAGNWVTFTVTATAVAPGGGTPTGTVTFQDNGTVIGTGTLSSGQATYTTQSLAVGSHPIIAVYGGDGNFNVVTSSVYTETID